MPDFSFIEPKTLLLIVHLVGLALGVGGALISDAMFFKAIRDFRITKTEMGFLTLGSAAIITGLALLVLSGAGMFSLDPDRYLASTKFLAKMTIVALLVVNGIVLHQLQIPYLHRLVREGRSTKSGFATHRTLFLLGGAVSLVSWIAALTLGAFRTIPWPYHSIMGAYFAVLILVFCLAYVLRDRLIPIEMKKTAIADPEATKEE